MTTRRTWAAGRRGEASDGIRAGAVLSHFDGRLYPDRAAWQAALDASEVRVQWDPDYPPHGPKLARRAIQIGLSGETLRHYAADWLGQGQDIKGVGRQQAEYAEDAHLRLGPAQRTYPVPEPAGARGTRR